MTSSLELDRPISNTQMTSGDAVRYRYFST
jgi:hypothetical protein